MSQAAFQREFDSAVLAPLRQFGRRLRIFLLVEGLAVCMSVAAMLLAAQFAADYLLVMERTPRAALLAVVLVLVGIRVRRRVLRPMSTRLTPDRLALTMEQFHPSLRDHLISAVQFVSNSGMPLGVPMPDESTALRGAAIRRAMADAGQLNPLSLLRSRKAFVHGVVIAVLLVIGVGASRAWPEHAAVFVSRDFFLRDVPWPTNRLVTLEGAQNGLIRWPRGDALTLLANIAGSLPRAMSLEYKLGDDSTGARPMSRLGDNRFRCEFGPLVDDMRIRFLCDRVGADDRTEWFRVEAVDRPRVQSAVVRVSPPTYTGQQAYPFPRGQVAGDVPQGSRVDFEIETNKPVRRAVLRNQSAEVGSASPKEIEGNEGRRWTAGLTPERSTSYTFGLIDDMGLEDTQPVSFSIRLLADRPPTVRLTLPGAGTMVVPNAIVPVKIEFEDNWGLASAEFTYESDRPGASTRPAPVVEPIAGFEPRATRFSHQAAWDLTKLNLAPQDRLMVSAQARDFKDTGDPNIGRSSAFGLRVVTPEELMGELARREQEWRAEFEAVLKAQEDVLARVRKLGQEQASADFAARLLREDRPQRQLATRLRKVRGQFELILSEMEINRMLTPAIRVRLAEGVIQPLGELANGDMPGAADLISRVAREANHAGYSGVEPALAAIVKRMNAVLAQMLKWEGYNEAAAMLREILKSQGELRKETQEELDKQLERLFGK